MVASEGIFREREKLIQVREHAYVLQADPPRIGLFDTVNAANMALIDELKPQLLRTEGATEVIHKVIAVLGVSRNGAIAIVAHSQHVIDARLKGDVRGAAVRAVQRALKGVGRIIVEV